MKESAAVLQCYSEDTIKQQGSYSLKGFAKQTDSLNDTLTRTVSPVIDLSGIDEIKFDIRASRTGTNIEIKIRDSGGTWTTKSFSIASTDTWQTVDWDISGVADADKNAIDRIQIKIVNSDADNTLYVDNMYSPEQFYKTFNETLHIAEAVGKSAVKGKFAEGLNIAESITKKTGKNIAVTLSVAEVIKKAVAKPISVSLSIAESITKKMTKGKFSETLTIAEAVSKGVSKKISETLNIAEVIKKGASKIIAETLTITETVKKGVSKVISVALKIKEDISRWFEKGQGSEDWSEEGKGSDDWSEEGKGSDDWKEES